MNEEQEIQVEDNIETEVDDVEIIDDTPEEDRGRARRASNEEVDIPDDDEIQKYSGGVQSRIKKLRFDYHEERRAKEEAERVREAAISDLQRLHEENQKLKETLNKGEGALVNQAKHRVEAELQKAKSSYKQAYEAGDTDAMVEANEQMAKLASEKVKYDSYQPKPAPQKEEFDQQKYATPQQPARLDARTEQWAKDNEDWFRKDKALTGFAYGIHEELVTQGVDPTSEEYFTTIDERMREAFPHKFGQQRRQDSIVAPATRTNKVSTQAKLTKSQAHIAQRLGLTNKQYWAQLQKEQRS
jgi:hypothetical protein